MACQACITHTNPEPCCGHDHGSHFGKPFGFDLVQVENPPWVQTAIGALAAFAGYRMDSSEESDIPFVLIMGGLAIPAMLWLKYSYAPSSE